MDAGVAIESYNHLYLAHTNMFQTTRKLETEFVSSDASGNLFVLQIAPPLATVAHDSLQPVCRFVQ